MGRVLRPSDRAAVVGVIDPDAYAAGTYTSDWVDVGEFERLMAIIAWGEMAANATLNAKLEQATDDQGSDAKDVSGKALTEVDESAVSPAPNDQQAVINMEGDEIDVDNGFTHVRLSVTTATAAVDFGAMVLGFDARYAPGADSDLASVAEIV